MTRRRQREVALLVESLTHSRGRIKDGLAPGPGLRDNCRPLWESPSRIDEPRRETRGDERIWDAMSDVVRLL